MLKKSPLRSRNRRSLVRQVGDRAKITGRLLKMSNPDIAQPDYDVGEDVINFFTQEKKLITSVSRVTLEEVLKKIVYLAGSHTTPEIEVCLIRDGYWGVVVRKRFEDFPQIYIQRLEQYRGKELPDLAPDRVYSTDIGHLLMLVVTQADNSTIFR
jgi:hypothetical protein